MSTVENRSYSLVCDGYKCGLFLPNERAPGLPGDWDEEWKAEAAAKRAGWTEDGSLHYCQTCAQTEGIVT